jgi:hypothetical protein
MYLGLAKAPNELLRNARDWHSAERVVWEIELALQPGTEGSKRADTPCHAARRKRTVSMRPEGDEPAADDWWTQFGERRRVAGTLEEGQELRQVITVPADRPRTSAGYLQGHVVLGHEIAEP